MVNVDAIRNAVGVVGNIISFGLFASPTPTFWRILKKKDAEEFSAEPYLATFMNCMLWVFYGLPIVHPHSILVVTINGIGLVIEGAYLLIYFIYTTKKNRLRVLFFLLLEVVFMTAVVVGVLLGAHTHDKRSMIVGILCVIFGTAMYFSPLTIMKKVITTKSVEFMPFYLSLANLCNGICWTIYALLRFDLYVLIPNGLGAIGGLAQIILYCTYRKSTPKKGSKSVELPTVSGGPGNNNAGGGNVSITVER